jgi:hypothetical protein
MAAMGMPTDAESTDDPMADAIEDGDIDLSVERKVQEAAATDDEVLTSMAPKGDFSRGALNSLVAGLNAVMMQFGVMDKYPSFEADIKQFPVDFVRQLGMVKQAVDDAIAAEAISADMAFDLSAVYDDKSIAQVAGRLTRLARDRDFKKFLQAPVETKATETMEDMSEGSKPEGSEAAIEDFLLSRV